MRLPIAITLLSGLLLAGGACEPGLGLRDVSCWETRDCPPEPDAGGPGEEESPVDAGFPDAGPPDASVPCAHFVTEVVEHHFGTGQDHNQRGGFPEVLYGPPVANDPRAVVSLGNGGHITVRFGVTRIVDLPGPDFTVFENPMPGFAELARVSVSEDGVTWHDFPCAPGDAPDVLQRCAGIVPVRSSPGNGVDPLDPSVSGGDAFDLGELGLTEARYVRISDREDLDGVQGVFDLDAIGVVHGACP